MCVRVCVSRPAALRVPDPVLSRPSLPLTRPRVLKTRPRRHPDPLRTRLKCALFHSPTQNPSQAYPIPLRNAEPVPGVPSPTQTLIHSSRTTLNPSQVCPLPFTHPEPVPSVPSSTQTLVHLSQTTPNPHHSVPKPIHKRSSLMYKLYVILNLTHSIYLSSSPLRHQSHSSTCSLPF